MSSRSRQWRFRLHHIIEALEKIHNYVDGMSMEGFQADSRTNDAILRNLEIIGEAARLVPDNITSRHLQIPWGDMRAMRNVVAHEYDRVNLRPVWDAIHSALPPLVPLLLQLLEQEHED